MMARLLVLAMIGLPLALAGAVTDSPQLLIPDIIQGNPWSLPSAIGSSCTEMGIPRDGFWYIDRSLESVCGPRQVFCKNGIVDEERYCSSPLAMYVADFDATCHLAGSEALMAACGVQVTCTETSMRIVVDESAIWEQTASQLQLNTNDPDCKADWVDGRVTFDISLGDEGADQYWEKCGIIRTINSGLDVTYRTDVIRDMSRTVGQRYTEEHGTIVTREKCFMMHAKCQYAANGYVTGSFRSAGANAIIEEDEEQITFDLTFMDDSYTNPLDVPRVYTSDELYARGSIVTRFHPDLKASLRSCWATNFASPADVTTGFTYETYNLVTDRCGDDSTFQWNPDVDNSPYTDDFQFEAFRFFSDADNYEQDIWVHCSIVACDKDDSTSQFCTDQCTQAARRQRRETGLVKRDVSSPSMISKMSQDTITHKASYLGDRMKFHALEPVAPANQMFAYGLFVVGGVVALASVVLGVVLLKEQFRNEKYHVKLQSVHA